MHENPLKTKVFGAFPEVDRRKLFRGTFPVGKNPRNFSGCENFPMNFCRIGRGDCCFAGGDRARLRRSLTDLPRGVDFGIRGLRSPDVPRAGGSGVYLAVATTLPETRWPARDSPAGEGPAGPDYFGRRPPGPRRILHRRSVFGLVGSGPAGVPPTK